MILQNGLVFTQECIFEEVDVVIEKGCVARFAPPGSSTGAEVLDVGGCYVLPGFVDIHTHGAAGSDFCDGDPAGIERMLGYYAGRGITSVLMTTLSLREEALGYALSVARPYFGAKGYGAVLRGINMEGPFLNVERAGAQDPGSIVPPQIEVYRRLQALSGGNIRLVDIAPEVPGGIEFVRRVQGTCVVSLAHTNATYAEALDAFEAGASHVTHLFNAMPPFDKREPGVVGAASDKADFVEIIADGHHLHPAVVRSVFRWFGAQRICLISDSMCAAGMPDGTYSLVGLSVQVAQGRATLANGTLAGSVTDLAACCRRAVGFGVPLEEAVRAATLNPARAVGIDDTVGSLAPGKCADIVLWTKDLQPAGVFLAGQPQGSESL